MAAIQKGFDKVWLVIDARTANNGISSGVSRFVAGITHALCVELNKKQEKSEAAFAKLKILIVAKSDPADWMIHLVYKYPDVVSFWDGDAKGFFGRKIDKPTWLWPTLTLKKLINMTGNKIIWFAPANFDRPLFISNNSMAVRVIQVVHDSIPFLKLKGFGFLFRSQFKFLVTRALLKLPYVVTVSQHSAQTLASLVKKRTNALHIISDAVDELFGCNPKVFQKEMLLRERTLFLKELFADFGYQSIFSSCWLLGVGRSQMYKCWEIALQAIEKLNKSNHKKKIWFIRVGANNKEISAYNKKSSVKEYGKIKVYEELNLLILPPLSDTQLAKLYRISDLLVHPSIAEGFGLPPLEAALSGLPVIYRKGTAIDEHFTEGSLPLNFWNAIDSQYLAVWANQIEHILFDKKDSQFYRGLYNSENTRSYILNYCKTDKTFRWEDSANSLLNMIGNSGGIIEGI